jgi:hypothetical protein
MHDTAKVLMVNLEDASDKLYVLQDLGDHKL